MANTGQQTRAPGGGDARMAIWTRSRRDLAALRGDLAGVVQAIKGLGENAVAAAKRQQGAAVGRLTAGAEALADEATSAAKDQLAELERRIRAQPLAAVGIAFAVGLLFGSLRR